MSNIGKQRILIPKNVKLKCDGWKLDASGKYGAASITFPHHTQLIIEDNYLRLVAPHIDPALYGSLQRKLKALIHGLSLEYVTILEFVGVGYKPRIEKAQIILRLGFSHEISVRIPENLEVSHVKRNNLKITGSNFEKVRQFAYKLRSFRRPEPFKGKGIVILGEIVRRKEGKKKKYKMKNQKILIKRSIKKNLNATPLIDELISYGAFIGDHYKWTHYSQTSFILGYRNNYSFYDIQYSIKLLTKAGRFLKTASKNKNVEFIFVGNPKGGEEQSTIIFNNIGIKFFPNEKWEPGFFSKKPNTSNYVLIVYNLCINNIAFQEGVNANIPVVAFATPSCDIRGVDYPVILNLKNNKIWYANFCKALFIK